MSAAFMRRCATMSPPRKGAVTRRLAALPMLGLSGMLVGALLAPRAADGQPTPTSPAAAPTLSLADALALAERSALVRVALAAAAAERARVDAIRRPANPLLGLGTTRYSGNRLVTFSQDIRWAGPRGYAVASA